MKLRYSVAPALLALALTSGAAFAVTVANGDATEITIGADSGNSEKVHKIAAGGSLDLSGECPTGCGLTGPWSYSHLATPGEALTYKDGKLTGSTTQ